jgi:hypothetical protein
LVLKKQEEERKKERKKERKQCQQSANATHRMGETLCKRKSKLQGDNDTQPLVSLAPKYKIISVRKYITKLEHCIVVENRYSSSSQLKK